MKIKKVFVVLGCLVLSFSCTKTSDVNAVSGVTTAVDKTANLLGTGDSAHDLLANDNFTKLKIEIAYVEGYRPTTSALNDFVIYLKKHTFKQDIELVFNELKSPNEENLTLDKIVELEDKNRTVFNNGKTLGVYIYFADAPSSEDDEDERHVTLGAVYRNTSMIIYEETVRSFARLSAFISEADIESATINHEFGHLFGLVDLGSTQVNDHQDPEARSHCNVPGCLMRAELQFNPSRLSKSITSKSEIIPSCTLTGRSVLKMLESNTAKGTGITPDLDPECILDLQANGGR